MSKKWYRTVTKQKAEQFVRWLGKKPSRSMLEYVERFGRYSARDMQTRCAELGSRVEFCRTRDGHSYRIKVQR